MLITRTPFPVTLQGGEGRERRGGEGEGRGGVCVDKWWLW